MKVVVESSLFSLQKLCLSCDYKEFTGRYALIRLSPSLQHLVQIFCKRDINPNFCVLDKTVIAFSKVKEHDVLQSIQECSDLNDLNFDNVEFVDNIQNIKDVSLSIVFKNAWFTSKWKTKTDILIHLLKEILKMFVVSCNSVIFPDCVDICRNLGVYCILIHEIDVCYGKTSSSTKLNLNELLSRNWYFSEKPRININRDTSIYSQVKNHCMTDFKETNNGASFSQINHNILLAGPPGCGKTTLVYCVAADCHLPLISVCGPELCHPQPGKTEETIKKIFEEAKLLAAEKRKGVCIILLDQIDSICSKKRSTHSARIYCLILQLLDSLKSSRGVIVIATTDNPDSLEVAIRRPPRLSVELLIGVPSESERKEILKTLCSTYDVDDSICQEVAKWTPGYVAADLAFLVSDAVRQIAKVRQQSKDGGNVLEIWRRCVSGMRPSTLRGELGLVTSSAVSMASIGGVSSAKKTLQKAIEWPLFHPDSFERLGIKQSKGVLLYGPPGCAKTSLVCAIANSTNTTFLSISAAAIYSPYVGDAERTIAHLFRRARLSSPAIIFIDEIDALVGGRGDRELGVQERVLSTLLTEMDGVGVKLEKSSSEKSQSQVVVVAATNRPHLLDPALVRPGRFDRLVYVGAPNADERLDILKKLTKKIPLGASVDLEFLAGRTELFSGADLSRLCKEAALTAMYEEGMTVGFVEQSHWMKALEGMKPSLSQEQVDSYRNLRFR